MRINIGDKKLVVGWKYEPSHNELATVDTICYIGEVKPDNTLVEVAADFVSCSKSDRFTREEGRKKSLTRVLNRAGFDKSTRTIVWVNYFLRSLPPDQRDALARQPMEL